jgi:ABC-type polysaccharide/polyol phosphate export permease
MARRDIATEYVGSILGFVWTFLSPLLMILVFWFVFSIGFRAKPKNDVPFVVWLTAGMCSWFVFADIINSSVRIIVSNSHLIKKTLFPSQILPVVKIVSGSIKHSVFLVVLIVFIIIHRMPFSLYYLQFVYYLFCMAIFALGFSWAVSALNVFIRDVGQIISVIMMLGFWGTPIVWDVNIMPDSIQKWLKLNPMYYIVQGYRESFIYFCPFWHHPYQTLYFWAVAVLFFLSGAMIFRKLKPQFADVL